MQRRQQVLDPRIGDAVPEGLGVAAEGDEAFLAHAREMLRQGGLGELDVVGELADRRLAAFDQPAQDQQPAVVGERAQQVGDLAGLGLEVAAKYGEGRFWSSFFMY